MLAVVISVAPIRRCKMLGFVNNKLQIIKDIEGRGHDLILYTSLAIAWRD
jgi:hypothetical protein